MVKARIAGVAAAAWLLFAAAPSQAESAALTRWLENADRLDRIFAAHGEAPDPPRSSGNAAVGELLRALSDPATLAGAPFDGSDLEQFVSVVRRASGITEYYLNYGIPEAVSPSSRRYRMQGNFIVFQDETVPLMSFFLDVLTEMTRLTGAGLRERAPAQEMQDRTRVAVDNRQAMSEIVAEYLGLTQPTELRPEQRLVLIRAVERNIPVLVPAMTLSQRAMVLGNARAVRDRLGPEARASLDRIVAALSDRRCEGMCAL